MEQSSISAKQLAKELLNAEINAADGITHKQAILSSMVQLAQRGDLKAAQFILELADEYKSSVSVSIGQPLTKEEAYSIIFGEDKPPQ